MPGKNILIRTTFISFLILLVSLLVSPAQAKSILWGNLEPGPYGVGFKTIEKYDYSRTLRAGADYLGTPISGENARPILIGLWYPAVWPDDALELVYGEYVFPFPHDSTFYNFLAQLQQGEFGVLNYLAGGIAGADREALNIDMAAGRDIPHAEGRFPLLIYFPHARSGYYDNLIMCEYLASHGFVVVSTPSLAQALGNLPPDDAYLETQVQDKAFAMANIRDLDFVDMNKLAVFGAGLGASEAILLRMRNYDIKAVACLGGTRTPLDYAEMARRNHFFNLQRMNVPLLYVHHGEGIPADLSLIDSCIYAERYVAALSDTAHTSFSIYDAMVEIMQDTLGILTNISRPNYETGCRYLHEFFKACLNEDSSAMAFMTGASPNNDIDPGFASVQIMQAQDQPPTPDQFIAVIRNHGAQTAEEIYREFNNKQPGSIVLQEAVINILGYQALQTGNAQDAVILFRLNTEVYPNSSNVWDSYADGLAALGENDKVIECYKRVLEVLPTDTVTNAQLKETLRINAEQGLERLQNPQNENNQ